LVFVSPAAASLAGEAGLSVRLATALSLQIRIST